MASPATPSSGKHFKSELRQEKTWSTSRGAFAIIMNCQLVVGKERLNGEAGNEHPDEIRVNRMYTDWQNNRDGLVNALEASLKDPKKELYNV